MSRCCNFCEQGKKPCITPAACHIPESEEISFLDDMVAAAKDLGKAFLFGVAALIAFSFFI